MLEEGDVAPIFRLPNEDNVDISLGDLGNLVVLYFYPKDNTPGCTTESIDFSLFLPEFRNLGACVVGISPDNPQSHKKFKKNQDLKTLLLCDEDKKVAQDYFCYGDKNLYGKIFSGVIRSTFIVKDGRIAKTFYNVRANGHAQKVLEALKIIVN